MLVIEGRGPGVLGRARSRGDDRRTATPAFYEELFSTCVRLMTRVHELPQPVIAKVHGVATAAGLPARRRVRSRGRLRPRRASRHPGVNIGLFCSTPMVPVARTIGRKRALEMLFTGEMIDARDRARMGPRQPRRRARTGSTPRSTRSRARIASASPYVVALGKRAFYAQDQLPEHAAYDIAAPVMVDNAQADDAHEGMRAFLEKRAPQWRNR